MNVATEVVTCPKCGGEDLRLWETAPLYYHVTANGPGKVLSVYYDEAGDGNSDYHLWCNACNYEWEMPADVELDFG